MEFDGTVINQMRELPMIVAQTEVGKTVRVKIWRNKKEIFKKIKLGRLETSSDFKPKKPKVLKTTVIDDLKIEVRPLNDEDIEKRKLPKDITGVVITSIDADSPVKNLMINNIIIEAQKKKIKTPGDLQNIVKSSLVANNKTILVVIYNNENQISYIGIKLK